MTEEGYLITMTVEAFAHVKEVLEKKGIKCEESNLAMVPKTLVEVSDADADLNITLIEWLENLDDVDAVYHNMKISGS